MEGNNKKGNNTILWVIIILLVFVVGILIGYILVDKTNQSKPTTQEQTTTREEKKDEKINKIEPEEKQSTKTYQSIKEFPQENDRNVIDYGYLSSYIAEDLNKTEFKNVTRDYLGSTITYNCTSMGELIEDVDVTSVGCYTVNISIDGAFSFETETPFGYRGCSYSANTYQYNNYFINVLKEGCMGRRNIKIYDKMGNLKKEINDITDHYSENVSNEKIHTTEVAFQNNRIYFVKIVEAEDTHAQLSFNSINLSESALTEESIQSFEGYISGK